MKTFIVVLSVFVGSCVFAQRTVATRHLAWSALFVEYRFNPAWSLNTDAQFRYEYTDNDIFAWLIRSGITYKTSGGWWHTAGLAYFEAYPNPNGLPPRPEFRPWLETGKRLQAGRNQFSPRIRVEHRNMKNYQGDELSERFSFHSFRLRLRCDYQYAFGATRKFFALAGDEIICGHWGKGYSAFDQHRWWVGAGYRFSEICTAHLSYLHWFQQRKSDFYDQYHVIRATVQLTFAHRSKTSAQ